MNPNVLTEIIIYPIKSLRGVSLKSSFAGIRGLSLDRRWMIVDQYGHFLTQRKLPRMATFGIKLLEQGFEISHGNTKILVPFKIDGRNRIPVTIWKSNLNVVQADTLVNEWFSDNLKHQCNLVYMDDSVKRHVSSKYLVNEKIVSFADGFPYLIIGEASLRDLNSRMKVKLPMDRFRPNLVFSGEEAFKEDYFDVFLVGKAKFKAVKPCARCIVTTTDQYTGVRGDEPLRTLSEYRKKDNMVLFGQNLICLEQGQIHKGDQIIL